MRYLSKNKSKFLLFSGLLLLCIAGCKVQSKFDRDYPEYTSMKNTTEAYKMNNDSTNLYLRAVAADYEYGRSPESPIFVGVTNYLEGGKNRVRFLNALAYEDGTPIRYKRVKSCCPFKTFNSRTIGADQKFGLLDVWVVYPGDTKEKSDTLYINAYDQGMPKIPLGYMAIE